MTYEEKLAAVVLTLTGNPVLFPAEDIYHANYRIEDHTLPVVMVLPNGLGGIEIKTHVTRNAGIALWFADKVDMDVPYSTKRECWERMHLLAAEFLVKAGNSVHFFPATEVTYEETHDELDVNLCGVTYFMKLKERNGLNVCDLKI
jgi:hypothetical protein